MFECVSTDLSDLSVSTTPATTTFGTPVYPPVRSTSVSPPQTPPAASLSVPPVLVIVLGVVLLLLLVPLLILIQQNRVMRRGRRDPETVILSYPPKIREKSFRKSSFFACLYICLEHKKRYFIHYLCYVLSRGHQDSIS